MSSTDKRAIVLETAGDRERLFCQSQHRHRASRMRSPIVRALQRLLVASLVGLVSVQLASAQAFTNADVITLVNAGLSDDVVIARIRSGDNSFTLATTEIVRLKEAGVSDRIIQAMVETASVKGSVSSGGGSSVRDLPPAKSAQAEATEFFERVTKPNVARSLVEDLNRAVSEGKSAEWKIGWGLTNSFKAYSAIWRNGRFVWSELTERDAKRRGFKEHSIDIILTESPAGTPRPQPSKPNAPYDVGVSRLVVHYEKANSALSMGGSGFKSRLDGKELPTRKGVLYDERVSAGDYHLDWMSYPDKDFTDTISIPVIDGEVTTVVVHERSVGLGGLGSISINGNVVRRYGW